MTYRVILPITRPELAKVCFESMDEEVRKRVIMVDNTVNNIGVSRSWNIGVSYVLDNNIDFLIICSQSMVFNDGLRDLVAQLDRSEGGKNTKFGWHLIVLGNNTLSTCGFFDTNFYPAYFEDSDYIRRMEIARIHEPNGSIHLPFADVNAYEQGTALSVRGSSPVAINYGATSDYFKKKWGGDPIYTPEARSKLYYSPFNNPDFSINYFEEKSIDELKREYHL